MGQTRPSQLFRPLLSYGSPDQKVTYAIRKLVYHLQFYCSSHLEKSPFFSVFKKRGVNPTPLIFWLFRGKNVAEYIFLSFLFNLQASLHHCWNVNLNLKGYFPRLYSSNRLMNRFLIPLLCFEPALAYETYNVNKHNTIT